MSEINPSDIMSLAALIVTALEGSRNSAIEKVAALRTAASAIEQAAVAQQVGAILANLGTGVFSNQRPN